MEEVYILEHVYEFENTEEIKFIGVFTTRENALNVIKELKDLPGFNRFDENCFQISQCRLNHYEWKSGFISWEEANED
ncbi:hypothetical protein ACFFLS_03585 [Flavobacterium procerum]|uniref:DUF7336 domain-containing protein n=1 Tax=Flavobacterium procerum TaxID=1455569 RepID=A0ABV6BMB9_9FLAO